MVALPAAVERLTSSPAECVKRFKAGLAGLKRSRRFYDWRAGDELCDKLLGLLKDLEAGVADAKTGVAIRMTRTVATQAFIVPMIALRVA